MSRKTLTIAAALAFASTLSQAASAMPQMPGCTGLQAGKGVRLAHSPLPPRLRPGGDVLLVRDVRQVGGGGGCWSHCYNMYDECLGVSDKTVCVTRIKTCMETCDRLSGIANPTQR